MLLYILIGAFIGGLGAFLITFGRKEKAHSPEASSETSAPTDNIPAAPRRAWNNIIGTTIMGVAVGGFLGYMAYQLNGPSGPRSREIIEITSPEQFDQVVINSDKPVLVEFYTQWCTVCHKMIPTISDIADETKGKAAVVMVDAEAVRPLAEKYDIKAYPIFLVFKKGQPPMRFEGGQSKETLQNALLK
jgi:thioredoxin